MGLMGLVIFVLLPLVNVLPSLSLVLLSLGWMFRDGLALVLSAATGLAGLAYGLAMAHLAWVWITPYIDLSRAVVWLQDWL